MHAQQIEDVRFRNSYPTTPSWDGDTSILLKKQTRKKFSNSFFLGFGSYCFVPKPNKKQNTKKNYCTASLAPLLEPDYRSLRGKALEVTC